MSIKNVFFCICCGNVSLIVLCFFIFKRNQIQQFGSIIIFSFSLSLFFFFPFNKDSAFKTLFLVRLEILPGLKKKMLLKTPLPLQACFDRKSLSGSSNEVPRDFICLLLLQEMLSTGLSIRQIEGVPNPLNSHLRPAPGLTSLCVLDWQTGAGAYYWDHCKSF